MFVDVLMEIICSELINTFFAFVSFQPPFLVIQQIKLDVLHLYKLAIDLEYGESVCQRLLSLRDAYSRVLVEQLAQTNKMKLSQPSNFIAKVFKMK